MGGLHLWLHQTLSFYPELVKIRIFDLHFPKKEKMDKIEKEGKLLYVQC
jgi:hypothetical protein